ncbi:thiazole tautomerase TenI [Priestia flexa]|uniref:Transcriptional regulator n=2 Tax=Priestia TaxID=2800373 RepID=A0A0V8JNX4_9BACI|nr:MULTISPECIES: thiazole tautomerase TenI [Bacillaceae]KSU88750.1 transcriptional regulator [Priestia veravalensis]KZB92100.1 thiamine phosphate synthase [Bacillus sp. VT 712]MBN8253532.1 thiazole tautomerase TenI [Priestia flexa]MBN8435585.1 thiazole tautomerase TenI [Priestia flexa]MBY6087067.1 thiazole tautomerase TenI [Priestia flexa]
MVPKLHAVSTGKQPLEQLLKIIRDIEPYVGAIHIREKERTARELEVLIGDLKKEVPASKLIVNDRVDVAFAAQVKGVHLAYHSLSAQGVKAHFQQLIVGKSVHSVKEAKEAEQSGVDYVIYGHIYPSQSKLGQTPRGLEQLKQVVDSVQIPVIAIGGVMPCNVREVLSTGAHGVAVMAGVFKDENPLQAAKEYGEQLRKWSDTYGGTL